MAKQLPHASLPSLQLLIVLSSSILYPFSLPTADCCLSLFATPTVASLPLSLLSASTPLFHSHLCPLYLVSLPCPLPRIVKYAFIFFFVIAPPSRTAASAPPSLSKGSATEVQFHRHPDPPAISSFNGGSLHILFLATSFILSKKNVSDLFLFLLPLY
ncbi:hypothetical protein HN873_054053 [Arachis hypogaea]